MRMKLAILAASLSLAPLCASAQLADVICDDTARLEQRLTQTHGAEKHGQGLRGPDAILQVWISPRSGDWTLVQSYANGTSCIVAMGEHWETLLPPADPA
ncbi:hypothetical protein SAMN05421850_10870 [Lutimaribacter saemankumensis]|uniref:Uncharacterized protein n=1 Tax=Lutimaribacter saemankumensis TaxID=490829 RepID=A0A1G8QS50_9RHOB|nr:hypothetical protein SAMN05421850_10870 [Lutimaribacter saemankumensis]